MFIYLQEIYAKDSSLNVAQKRVIRKFLLEARLNGIELPPEKNAIFTNKLKMLEVEKSEFRRKVLVSIC